MEKKRIENKIYFMKSSFHSEIKIYYMKKIFTFEIFFYFGKNILTFEIHCYFLCNSKTSNLFLIFKKISIKRKLKNHFESDPKDISNSIVIINFFI